MKAAVIALGLLCAAPTPASAQWWTDTLNGVEMAMGRGHIYDTYISSTNGVEPIIGFACYRGEMLIRMDPVQNFDRDSGYDHETIIGFDDGYKTRFVWKLDDDGAMLGMAPELVKRLMRKNIMAVRLTDRYAAVFDLKGSYASIAHALRRCFR